MSAGISFIGLLVIVFVIVIVVVLIAGIIFLIVRRKPSDGDTMSCGACGYAVRGASSLTCPECGADLREVGIRRPTGSANRWVLVAVIVSAILLLGCVCMGLFGFVGLRAPSPPRMPIPAAPAPTETSAPPMKERSTDLLPTPSDPPPVDSPQTK